MGAYSFFNSAICRSLSPSSRLSFSIFSINSLLCSFNNWIVPESVCENSTSTMSPSPVRSQRAFKSLYVDRIFSILRLLIPLPFFRALPKAPMDRPHCTVTLWSFSPLVRIYMSNLLITSFSILRKINQTIAYIENTQYICSGNSNFYGTNVRQFTKKGNSENTL